MMRNRIGKENSHLAPVEVDGSQFGNMLLSALRVHTGTGQDLRSMLVQPTEMFILCIHFLSKTLQGKCTDR